MSSNAIKPTVIVAIISLQTPASPTI